MPKSFTLNDKNILLQEEAVRAVLSSSLTDNERNCLEFILSWISGYGWFAQFTSGSTGPPKEIMLKRSQLEASALLTRDFFRLEKGDTLFCCLGTHYIGGKMMLVRSMVLDLPLIVKDPDSRPFLNLEKEVAFTSMVPLQLKTTLMEGTAEELEKLNKNKAILLGGASVSQRLLEKIQTLTVPVYHSFATTETASHIAMRSLNGTPEELYYTALPGVAISQTERGTLSIKGAVTQNEVIETSDLIELKGDGVFRWLGRTDFVINSGGIKIFPESLEGELSLLLQDAGIGEYLVSSLPDESLSEKIVLCVDKLNVPEAELITFLQENLPRYLVPKMIVTMGPLPKTASGKPDRLKLRKMLDASQGSR